MKAFVTSIPKSGTYLMCQYLDILGLNWTGHHVREDRYIVNKGINSLEQMAKLKEQGKYGSIKRSLSESIDAIPENGFSIGHVQYQCHNQLSDCKVIFMHRELRHCILSWRRHRLTQGGKFKNHLDSIKRCGNYILNHAKLNIGWMESKYLPCKFESITNESTAMSEVIRIVEFLGIQHIDPSIVVDEALRKQNLTKRSKNTTLEEWTPAAEQWFKLAGGVEFNRALGFSDQPIF